MTAVPTWMERLRAGEALTDTERGRAILRCGSCKTVGTVGYTLTRTTRLLSGRPRTTVTVLPDGAARPLTVDGTRLDPVAWALHRTCACGSAAVEVRVVKGTVVASRACDARCMGATGPTCSCSCGGENHGGGHPAF